MWRKDFILFLEVYNQWNFICSFHLTETWFKTDNSILGEISEENHLPQNFNIYNYFAIYEIKEYFWNVPQNIAWTCKTCIEADIWYFEALLLNNVSLHYMHGKAYSGVLAVTLYGNDSVLYCTESGTIKTLYVSYVILK